MADLVNLNYGFCSTESTVKSGKHVKKYESQVQDYMRMRLLEKLNGRLICIFSFHLLVFAVLGMALPDFFIKLRHFEA